MIKIYVIFIYVLLVSCSLSKIKRRKVYSDNNQIEYNYSFTEATKQKIFGNYSQAINLFNRCVKLNPQSGAVYFQLSDIYSIIGEKNNALKFARVAEKLDKKNIWYKVHLAQIYQMNDKIDSTIYVYHKILKINPKYEYQFNYALLFIRAINYKKSIRILKRLDRKYGFNKEIAVSLYKIYSIENNNKNAIKVLKEAIKQYPEESHFYGLLAEHYASMGENELALQYYNKLLNLDPENEKGILSLFEFYRNVSKYSEAIDLAGKIILNETFIKEKKSEIINTLLNDNKCFNSYQNEIKDLCENLCRFYNNEPSVRMMYVNYFIKTEELGRARNELISMINNEKGDFVIWDKLFNVLNSLGDFEALFKYSKESLTYFKDRPELYLFCGISAYQLKDYEIAINLFSNGLIYVVNSNTLKLQFYTFMGETYNSLQYYIKSDSCFELALNIDKQNIYILNNYSYYLATRSEKLERAFEYIKRCLEIEPKNYIYLGTYGWVLFKMGKLEEAKDVIEKSILIGGSQNSDVLLHYVYILIKLNQKDEARKYYKIVRGLGKCDKQLEDLMDITD